MVLHLNSLRIGLNSKLYWIVFIKSDRWSINQFFHRYEGLSIAKVPLFYLHSRPSFSLFFVSDLCFLVNFSQFIELPFVCFSIWLSIGSAIDSRHLFQKRDYKVFLSISFHCLHEEFGGLLIFIHTLKRYLRYWQNLKFDFLHQGMKVFWFDWYSKLICYFSIPKSILPVHLRSFHEITLPLEPNSASWDSCYLPLQSRTHNHGELPLWFS